MRGARMSCHAFAADRFRLLIRVTAYIPMYLLREHLADTALARPHGHASTPATQGSGVTARRIWLELSATHPLASLWPRLVPLLR